MDEGLFDDSINIELSPNGQFMVDNIGYRFFDNETGEQIDKWEIWATYKDQPVNLRKIYEGKHKIYRRDEVYKEA